LEPNTHAEPESNPSAAASHSFAYRSYVLAVLVVVYAFNFIDRQIIGILAVPVKHDLSLTDSQLGLMGGLAFALFYTFLDIPIARLADRVRTFLFINNLIGIGLGTTLIGALSDALRLHFGADSLRYAILAGTGFYVLAALFYFFAARHLVRDWED
jgi:sugar phosphate permease